ncbi:hypothetical protein AHF37_04729 [Paragonimus kellicotti]|nr:hypothetical protein AHF37_04729 [Paragonimus kellicotti]
MEDLDLNKDGVIKLAEYRLSLGLTDEPLAEWKRLFHQLDTSRSGTVTRAALATMFEEVGICNTTCMLDAWINDHDVNGDGMLNYQEFIDFVVENMAI